MYKLALQLLYGAHFLNGSLPKLEVPYLGVFIIRILLFRILYQGPPGCPISETPKWIPQVLPRSHSVSFAFLAFSASWELGFGRLRWWPRRDGSGGSTIETPHPQKNKLLIPRPTPNSYPQVQIFCSTPVTPNSSIRTFLEFQDNLDPDLGDQQAPSHKHSSNGMFGRAVCFWVLRLLQKQVTRLKGPYIQLHL